MSEAGRELVAALEALVQISEEEAVALLDAREHSSRMGDLFKSSLARKLRGENAAPRANLTDFLQSKEQIYEPVRRSARREEAFLSAFRALMPLWSDEATRESAARVFELLCAIRRNDLDASLPDDSMPMPPLAEMGDEPGLAFLTHQSIMEEWMSARQGRWDEQVAKGEAYLREALAVARSIAVE